MNKINKNALITASVLAAVSHMNTANSHTVNLTLDPTGANTSATNLVQVDCSNADGGTTDHLYFEIQTNAWNYVLPPASSRLNAQVAENMTNPPLVMNVSAPVNDFVNHSPTLRVPGGNGSYNFLTDKTAPGQVAFTVTAHCLNANESIHTGTNITILQQQ